MRNITNTIQKNKMILLLILSLQICGAITFATVNAKYLHGKSDNLFYFWRYGAFSLFGIISGMICSTIPFEKMGQFYNKTVKWVAIMFALLAVSLFLFDLFFYYDHGFILKDCTLAWLDPIAYANSNGYLIVRNMQIREDAQLLGGQGIGFTGIFVSEMVLSYIIGTCGWILFGMVVFLAVCLMFKMFIRSIRIEITICRFIAMAIWVYIAFSFLWNIAMVFNIMPLTSSHFPFVSYDRFSLVFDLCMMGIFIRMITVN